MRTRSRTRARLVFVLGLRYRSSSSSCETEAPFAFSWFRSIKWQRSRETCRSFKLDKIRVYLIVIMDKLGGGRGILVGKLEIDKINNLDEEKDSFVANLF